MVPRPRRRFVCRDLAWDYPGVYVQVNAFYYYYYYYFDDLDRVPLGGSHISLLVIHSYKYKRLTLDVLAYPGRTGLPWTHWHVPYFVLLICYWV